MCYIWIRPPWSNCGGDFLTDAFNNLEREKKDRIINSALSEFGKKGYQDASTNQIVKEADIGKGMLFYYFNTKHELYEFLIDYSLDFIKSEYIRKINFKESDFIKRMENMAHAKLEAINKNEYVFNFLARVSLNDRSYVSKDLISEIDKTSQEMISSLYKNLDMSFFKEDIPKEVTLKFISWIIEGYQNELINKFRDLNLEEIDMAPYWEEFDYYLDKIRIAFYK